MSREKERKRMIFAGLPWLVLVVGLGLPGAGAASAEDDDAAVLAAALTDAKITLQDGLNAGEREGQPISAQFEIDDGELRISIYTTKGDDFVEVVADPKTGAILSSEKITDGDDLDDAAEQKAAMAKATISLLAAADAAAKDNAGTRVVGIFPELKDGHPVAEVTLLRGTTPKRVTQKLD
jgi:hypothetical protein